MFFLQLFLLLFLFFRFCHRSWLTTSGSSNSSTSRSCLPLPSFRKFMAVRVHASLYRTERFSFSVLFVSSIHTLLLSARAHTNRAECVLARARNDKNSFEHKANAAATAIYSRCVVGRIWSTAVNTRGGNMRVPVRVCSSGPNSQNGPKMTTGVLTTGLCEWVSDNQTSCRLVRTGKPAIEFRWIS